MKDLNLLTALLEVEKVSDKKEVSLRLYFYDPQKFSLQKIYNDESWSGNKFIISATHFLEYTDGSPEENAKILERFPNTISFLKGETIEIQDCYLFSKDIPISHKLGSSFSYLDLIREFKIVVYAGHDAWSLRNKTNAYKIEISFDNAQKYFTNEIRRYCKIECLQIRLMYPEIPKRGDRLYASPVRFDKFTSFRELKWLLLAMSMWPKNILLFSAVTKYYQEKPFISTIVYRPEYHTMREVFMRLFSKTRKGFSNSLFDICKVLDIMEKNDSNSKDEKKYTGYGKIGGWNKATIRAYLGLRSYCSVKEINKFLEVLNNEIEITYEFCKKLEKLKQECKEILKEDPESNLKNLGEKLIGKLYDQVLLDPLPFASMYTDNEKYDSRDITITKILSNMCLTSKIEEELLDETPKGDDNG